MFAIYNENPANLMWLLNERFIRSGGKMIKQDTGCHGKAIQPLPELKMSVVAFGRRIWGLSDLMLYTAGCDFHPHPLQRGEIRNEGNPE